MSFTNTTEHYGLPQYIGTDKPTQLGDFNMAMEIIDGQMYKNSVQAGDNTGVVAELTTEVNTLKTSVGTANQNVSNLEQQADTLESNLNTTSQNANSALTSAQNAQQSATTANTTANSAQSTATQAQTQGNANANSIADLEARVTALEENSGTPAGKVHIIGTSTYIAQVNAAGSGSNTLQVPVDLASLGFTAADLSKLKAYVIPVSFSGTNATNFTIGVDIISLTQINVRLAGSAGSAGILRGSGFTIQETV